MNTTFTWNNTTFVDNNKIKKITSSDFNLYFNKEDGYTERWGKTRNEEDDPIFSPLGPTLMDMELSKDIHPNEMERYKNELKVTGHGCLGKCPMCYKSNGCVKYTHFMSLEKFKNVLMKCCNTHVKIDNKLIYHLDKIHYNGKLIRAIDYPKLNWETDICNCSPLLQLALGITNLDANPELLQICEFSKKLGIIPNVTCHGKDKISDDFLKRLCQLCGNIAVSRYDRDQSYNFIERLHYCGAKYINMHLFVSEETVDNVIECLKDSKRDKRLKYLTSCVLLFLKQKGRGTTFHRVSQKNFEKIFNFALHEGISFGFDVCCSNKFTELIKHFHNQKLNFPYAYDKCDANRFSGYVNSLGEYCPCSFIENDGMWLHGPSVIKCHNFIDEIWNSEKSRLFRTLAISNNMKCLYYEI